MKNKDIIKKTINIYNFINSFSHKMKENQLDIYAGATAFFLILSLIPFAMLLLSIIPYTPVTDENLLTAIAAIIPTKIDDMAVSYIYELENHSIASVPLSAIGALWMSAWGVQTLKKGLNRIHGVIEDRNFVLLRLNALIYTLIFLIAVVILFVFNVFSSDIYRRLSEFLSNNDWTVGGIWLDRIFMIRRYIVILISFIVCLYLFWALPNAKLTFKSQMPGAIFVAIIWMAFSKLFNIYINNFDGYGMYGSLSFMVILNLWMYTSMYIFFIGAQINYYLSETYKKDKI